MRTTTLAEDDDLAQQLASGECWCGEPSLPGRVECESSGAWLEEQGARDERRRKREAAKAERARQLRELAERGCRLCVRGGVVSSG